jgi:hypothetical protein
MTEDDINDRLRRFEDDLRMWGSRPPGTPAHIARVKVSARLEAFRHPWSWFRLAAAAAMLVVVVVAVWRGTPRPGGDVKARAAVLLQPPLDPNVVVWVVDGHTTVYFVLSPDGLAKGGVS